MTPGSIDETAAWYRYSYSWDIMTPFSIDETALWYRVSCSRDIMTLRGRSS